MPAVLTSPRFSILLSFAVVAAGARHVLDTMVNHDGGYYLHAARAIMDGRDLHDTFAGDMPSNVWLPVLSLRLSDTLGMVYADVHQALLLVFVVACAILMARPITAVASRGSLVAVASAPWTLAVLLFVPRYAFGQRDHLFAAGFVPLVTTLGARTLGFSPGLAFCFAVALVSAFGISQKPYFALPALVLGGAEWLIRRRRISALPRELWLTALSCAAFVLGTHLVYPEFFTRILSTTWLWYAPLMKPMVQVLASTRCTSCSELS
jgi:hypothetical protein